MKIGVFPRSLESFFIEFEDDFDVYYLVAKGTQEEIWINNFINKEKIIYYNFKRKKHSLYGVEEILKFSNITEILLANKIKAILLSSKSSNYINNWSIINKIKAISTNFELQKFFENKIKFDNFLANNNFCKPRTLESGKVENIEFKGKKLVLQEAKSMGSEGTFMINDFEDIKKLKIKGIFNKKNLLLRQYVEGEIFGITVFIDDNLISLSALRRQCFYDFNNQKFFAGVQWVKYDELSNNLIKKINKVFIELGKKLSEKRFFGFANIDFIFDGNEIFIIECNPRFSAATTQLLSIDELISKIDVGKIFINSFFGKKNKLRGFDIIPKTKYQGATLDLMPKNNIKITNIFKNGLYKFENNEISFVSYCIYNFKNNLNHFIYYSDCEMGETYYKYEDFANIFTNFCLYDKDQKLNDKAKKLIKYFVNYDY